MTKYTVFVVYTYEEDTTYIAKLMLRSTHILFSTLEEAIEATCSEIKETYGKFPGFKLYPPKIDTTIGGLPHVTEGYFTCKYIGNSSATRHYIYINTID